MRVRCHNCGAVKTGQEVLTDCCGGYKGKSNYYHRKSDTNAPAKSNTWKSQRLTELAELLKRQKIYFPVEQFNN